MKKIIPELHARFLYIKRGERVEYEMSEKYSVFEKDILH